MKIAVVGATGEVGRMMTRVLQERNVRPAEVSFFASARSAGDEVEFYGRKHRVKELTDGAMRERYDYLLFSAGGAVSKQFAPIAA